MSVRKRFSQSLHKETDKIAKKAAMKLCSKNRRVTLIENPNRHAVDLLIYNKKDEHIGNIEVEIKRNWAAGEDFKFPNVNFLSRKEKYCRLTKPTIFVIFNADLSQHLVIKDTDVLASPLEEVRNRYVHSGELFYKIPLTRVKFNCLNKEVNQLFKK